MSAFSHTDWIVVCDIDGCLAQGRSDTMSLRDGRSADVRKELKRRGWAVAVPTGRDRRADFCPVHKAAGLAMIEESK